MNMPDTPSLVAAEAEWSIGAVVPAVDEMDQFVLSLGRVEGAFARMGALAEMLNVPVANSSRALISLNEVLASYGAWLWVGRNADAPHRCPSCHATARRFYEPRIGPRTVLRCPAGCRLQWRFGVVGYRRQVGSRSNSDPLLPWCGW